MRPIKNLNKNTMTNKIAILNFKGGVGKTTTAINLSAALARKKKNVLLVDLDSQCSSTFVLGYKIGDGKTVYDALMDENMETSLPVYSYQDCFDFVPASIMLRDASALLTPRLRKEEILKVLLTEVEGDYDYIILDCPPGDGLINMNAMCAVSDLIVPTDGDELTAQGINALLARVNQVKKQVNPSLNVLGFIFTKFEGNTRLHRDNLKEMREEFPDQIFNSIIHKNIKLKESPREHLTIFDYAPQSVGAEDYMHMAEELDEIYN